MSIATIGASTTTTTKTTTLQFGFDTADPGHGGESAGDRTCEWDDVDICTDTATNYVIIPSTPLPTGGKPVKYKKYLCPKHYVLELDHILGKIQLSGQYDECQTADEIKSVTMKYVCGFGSV